MNSIQRLSRDIEDRRLKLQMGLAPELEVDHETLHRMWRELSLERVREQLRRKFKETNLEDLPNRPPFRLGG